MNSTCSNNRSSYFEVLVRIRTGVGSLHVNHLEALEENYLYFQPCGLTVPLRCMLISNLYAGKSAWSELHPPNLQGRRKGPTSIGSPLPAHTVARMYTNIQNK